MRPFPPSHSPVLVGAQPRCGTTLLSSILNTAPELCQAYELHIRKPSFITGLEGRYTRNIFKSLGLPPDQYDSILAQTDTAGMNLGAWIGPKEAVSAEPLTGNETSYFKDELIARASLTANLLQSLASVHDKVGWGFKVLGDVVYAAEYLHAFPNARFVLLVRDPRDHALSILRLNKQRAERSAPAFYENVRAVAHGWRETYRTGWSELERLGLPSCDKAFLVRYEDLVRHPNKELDRIGKKLDIDLTRGFEFHQQDRVAIHARRFKHHDNVTKPISSASVGSWHSLLDADNAADILEVAGDTMLSFGYTEDGVDDDWSPDNPSI